jgi:ABC-type transport system involved in cytochrome bd biosynthesis fused ATPase/permease subunit
LNFHASEKVAVIGKVGSGKTSLFLTILKELCIIKGR